MPVSQDKWNEAGPVGEGIVTTTPVSILQQDYSGSRYCRGPQPSLCHMLGLRDLSVDSHSHSFSLFGPVVLLLRN